MSIHNSIPSKNILQKWRIKTFSVKQKLSLAGFSTGNAKGSSLGESCSNLKMHKELKNIRIGVNKGKIKFILFLFLLKAKWLN